MIIAFCGHSENVSNCKLENRILELLELEAQDESVVFYLGGYGVFDSIAHSCCKKYQRIHTSAKLYFITPYIDKVYLKNREILIDDCDGTIYPEIENTPRRYAILARNKWIVEKADLIIAYVNHSWGGAAKTLNYANKTKTRYINLGTYQIDK